VSATVLPCDDQYLNENVLEPAFVTRKDGPWAGGVRQLQSILVGRALTLNEGSGIPCIPFPRVKECRDT
jgi:hypothetical protein